MMRISLFSHLCTLVWVGTLTVGLAACSHAPGDGDAPADTAVVSHDTDMALYTRVLDRVRASYVKPVSEDKLVTNSLKGMLSSLDPHSDYLDESEYQDLLDESEGEFAGIGAEITRDDSHPKVIRRSTTRRRRAPASSRATSSSRSTAN